MRAVRPRKAPVLAEARVVLPLAPTSSVYSALAGLAGVILAAGLGAEPSFGADTPKIRIQNAWVPAVEQAGGDVPFLMIISNGDSEADNLLRVNCPFANFAEKHTVDRGEGAPPMRPIHSIPIPTGATVELKVDAYHIMLRQIRQRPTAGEKLACTVTFPKAGRVEAEVDVRSSS